jgi:hypothetical protein
VLVRDPPLFAEEKEEWRTPTMVSGPTKILEYDLKHGGLHILKMD